MCVDRRARYYRVTRHTPVIPDRRVFCNRYAKMCYSRQILLYIQLIQYTLGSPWVFGPGFFKHNYS